MKTGTRRVIIAMTGLALLVAAYAVVYGAWGSINDVLLTFAGIDKIIHFLAGAAIWCVCHFALLRWKSQWSQGVRVAIAFAATAAIVVADELSQSLSSQRTVELLDPLSGLAGSVVAFAVAAHSTWLARIAWAALPLSIVGWAAYDTYERNHFYFEGILLEREARYEEAYARFQLALTAAPDNAAIYNSLSWLCLEFLQRDYDKALDWALQGVALDPDNADLIDTLGWAFYKNGQLAPALEHVARAAEIDPDHPLIRVHLELLRAEYGGAPSLR
jgi:tetratricopeptide (TPR) repeat protein